MSVALVESTLALDRKIARRIKRDAEELEQSFSTEQFEIQAESPKSLIN